jgi:Icc-related predicted phosphoesterase
MKICCLNDLHLEFDRQPTLKLAGGDVLLLPGDVVVAAYLRPDRTDKDARVMRRVADAFFKEEFNRVYYIMGNHEHYRGVYDHTAEVLREYLEGTNVTLLDKEFVDLDDGWQLFGGTFWTDYNNDDYFAKHNAQNRMCDHTVIKKLRNVPRQTPVVGNFKPDDALVEFKTTIKTLEEGLYDYKRIDRKTIVMSHHAPSSKSVHPQFADDVLMNHAYYSDLSGLILDHPEIKYWFHGHMHDNHDYMVGDDCRVVCNPRGYSGYELNHGFDSEFNVEI